MVTPAVVAPAVTGEAPAPVAEPRKQDRDVVAINDFVGKGVTQSEADLITEEVRSQLMRNKKISVMERSMMDQILKEQGFQQSGACDASDCQVQVGRLLGVNRLVVGSIGHIGRIYMINAKIVDISTGEVLQSVTETYEGAIEDVLQVTAPVIAKRIATIFRRDRSGVLKITSTPVGAEVFVDSAKAGATPLVDSLMDPGRHLVRISMKDWKEEVRWVDIVQGKMFELNFPLSRSREWLDAEKAKQEALRMAAEKRKQDSLKAIEAQRKARLNGWRVTIGLATGALTAASYYFHSVAETKQSSIDDKYELYRQSKDQTAMNAMRKDIRNVESQRDNNLTYRNVGIGLAAAALSALTLTFVF
ncbi:MAG: hypothetical protein RL318_1812 [Fibrobacterota bacterium]|jgi:TolB-like protein